MWVGAFMRVVEIAKRIMDLHHPTVSNLFMPKNFRAEVIDPESGDQKTSAVRIFQTPTVS
jgi:hypothetical protein